jgi:hypothetical protein
MHTRYIPAFGLSVTLHLLAVLLWTAFTETPRAVRSKSSGKTIAVFDATPPEDGRFPGLNPIVATDEHWTLPIDAGPSPLSIGTFTFDATRIAEHAEVLFPFLIPGVSLEHFTLALQHKAEDHLTNPFAPAFDKSQAKAASHPLELSDAGVQATVDQAWSRHDRWRTFQPIKKLADTYSGDAGKLSNLLQAYREQDAFQPYADTTIRDPRLWTELELAADQVNFIGFIRQYAADHPSTNATTELLFLLERMAQASRNMLTTVLDTQPSEQLEWTRNANRTAYDLFVKIRQFYMRQLERRGLTSADAITAYFDKVRLAILTGILRTTPADYRANDARFLIGTIYWREHRREDAFQSWRTMTIDRSDSYVVAYEDILRVMSAHAATHGDAIENTRALNAEVAQILDAEHGRWVVFSFSRLRQFGYGSDTY